MSTRPLPTEGPSAGGGIEFDDLDDYGFDDPNDPFSANYVPQNAKKREQEAKVKGKDDEVAIDEEVKVSRKPRLPMPKLDHARLVSDAGIPKLRKKAKALKFKGKGHEYTDAANLLAFYQLWLDDLFPRARFVDALAMVEKTGHKKMMHSQRMEWINEGKPRSSVFEDSPFDDPALPPRENRESEATPSKIAPIFQKAATQRPRTPDANGNVDMADLYDATPKASSRPRIETRDSLFGGGASIFGATNGGEAPNDDDIDALMAEGENTQMEMTIKQAAPANIAMAQDDDEFDDLDALMAEQEMLVSKHAPKVVLEEDDFQDDLDALMAEQELPPTNLSDSMPTKKVVVQGNEFDDDLDALMAEQEMPFTKPKDSTAENPVFRY